MESNVLDGYEVRFNEEDPQLLSTFVVVYPDDVFGMKPKQVAIYCKQGSQCTYIRNKARSPNRRYCGKAISIKNYECELSSMQTASPYNIAICGLSDSAIFSPHHLINGNIFRGGGSY